MLFAQGLPPPSLDLLVEIKLMPRGGQDALFTQDSDDGDDDVGKRVKYRRKGDVAILSADNFCFKVCCYSTPSPSTDDLHA